MDLGLLHGFDEAIDFVDEIASPWLGVVLELNNAWIERRLYANVAARTDRIALVQVSDFKIGTLTASERVVIGDDDIPLGRIVAALEQAGYRGGTTSSCSARRSRPRATRRWCRARERFRALWT